MSHEIHSGCRPGLTLVETMVVVAIMAILTMLVVPTTTGILPSFQLRSAARGTAVVMEQARLMAANYQKPVRVAIDCRDRGAGGAAVTSRQPCIATYYVAVFDQAREGAFTGWRKVNSDGNRIVSPNPASGSRLMGEYVNIQPAMEAASVSDTPDGLFWAVFFPGGNLLSSHVPMALTYTAQGVGGNWRLSLNRTSGQVTVQRNL